MISASACGKAILLGEHAVVYGQPAIAVPLTGLRAFAEVESYPNGIGIVIEASDLSQTVTYPGNDDGDLTATALQTTVRNVLDYIGCDQAPSLHILLHSQLPTARGLGSGTAITTALVRALAQSMNYHLFPPAVSELVYRTEVIFHGQPSGIDNTVVAFEQVVLFQHGQSVRMLHLSSSFRLVIADTGIAAQTRAAVAKVRQQWQTGRIHYEALFTEIGSVVTSGRVALDQSDWIELGRMMDRNHELLSLLGVSCPELDRLVLAARHAGALGAKLSGGGLGGCMIALVEGHQAETVAQALTCAGAQNVWHVEVVDAHRD